LGHLATVALVEGNSKSTARSDVTKLTKTTSSTDKSTADAAPPVDNDLTSSAVKSRKRKAILLPDDYHSKVAVSRLDDGTLQLSP